MIPEGYREKYENPHIVSLVWKNHNFHDIKTMSGEEVKRVIKVSVSQEGNGLPEAKLTRIYLGYDQRHKLVPIEYEQTCIVGRIEVL